MMSGFDDAGWWTVMWVAMILFWGLVIAGAIALVKPFGRSGSATPEDALKRRLAAGEIDEEKYRALRDELKDRR